MTTKNKTAVSNLVHQNRDEVKNATLVQTLGRDIVTATGQLAQKYYALIMAIRQFKIPPKLVSYELQQIGFRRQRITEVNRIANAADKVFKSYEAKLIGFDKALDMARAEKPGEAAALTPAAKQLAEQNIVESGEVLEHESEPNEPSSKPKATMASRIKASAKFIASNATRNMKFSFKDCSFEVIINKLPVTKPALDGHKD